jgi:putative endonuclease
MFYIYILQSKLDNKLYTGFTSNLRKRLSEHNSGGVVSTRNRRPLELIYYEAYKKKEDALRREKFLKTTKGKLQLRKQISLQE